MTLVVTGKRGEGPVGTNFSSIRVPDLVTDFVDEVLSCSLTILSFSEDI
jgi:hypothetical protein